MTDADVDGSHIRTLLLTFFYRQMPELLQSGYLYIAQPPLYKVTRNKKELYLKDEAARDAYDLDLAKQHAKVISGGGRTLEGDELRELLSKIISYQDRLKKLSLRRDPRVLDALVQAAQIEAGTLLELERLNAEAEKIIAYLEAHSPEVAGRLEMFRKPDPEHQSKKLVFRTEVNGSPRETVLDHAFLSGPEYAELMAMKGSLAQLGAPPHTVQFDDESSTAQTVQQVWDRVRQGVSKGLNIQRYKGLGEMNPEQLWETTMDPARRTLLQVKVEDVVEADEIFSLLMGEAVEPRREFIEKNALDVQNLDI
jgi:DNA gyrase subunit B